MDEIAKGRIEMEFPYPYLVWSLLLLGSCLTGFYFFSRERKKILISAFLSMPAACTAILFVPEYWKPARIALFSIGIEDLIFSFATGGIVWFLVSFSVGRDFSYSISLSTVVKRYSILLALGLSLMYFLYGSTKWDVMAEAIVGIIIAGLILLVRFRFKPWRIAVAGSMLFTLYYLIITIFVLKLFPHMKLYWNNSHLWGISVFNVPLGEIVWAFFFGAVWPLAMAYVFDLKISKKDKETVSSVSLTIKT